jgi:hypothetical protein
MFLLIWAPVRLAGRLASAGSATIGRLSQHRQTQPAGGTPGALLQSLPFGQRISASPPGAI